LGSIYDARTSNDRRRRRRRDERLNEARYARLLASVEFHLLSFSKQKAANAIETRKSSGSV